MSNATENRDMLRHTVATLAYRAAKALRDAPESFANFRIADGSRTPAEILAHMGDLFEWALSIARGTEKWGDSKPLAWEKEVQRFFSTLEAFDACLASGEPLQGSAERF